MPEQRSEYVFDTVVLSNFALAGNLALVLQRYGTRARITLEVLDEVTDGVVAGYLALSEIEDAVAGGSLTCTPPLESRNERQAYRSLLRVLDPGEASCIAFASTHGAIVVTDDRTARECCNERGIPFTGTLGILKACCLDGALSPADADGLLTRMIEHGFYSPVQRISDLL